jgi:hypothetical protein
MHRFGALLVHRYFLDPVDEWQVHADHSCATHRWRAGPVLRTPKPALTQGTESNMPEAEIDTTTKHPDATLIADHLGDMEVSTCKYVAGNKVEITLQNKHGDIVTYTVKTSMLLHMVTLSMDLINSFKVQVLGDLAAAG